MHVGTHFVCSTMLYQSEGCYRLKDEQSSARRDRRGPIHVFSNLRRDGSADMGGVEIPEICKFARDGKRKNVQFPAQFIARIRSEMPEPGRP